MAVTQTTTANRPPRATEKSPARATEDEILGLAPEALPASRAADPESAEANAPQAETGRAPRSLAGPPSRRPGELGGSARGAWEKGSAAEADASRAALQASPELKKSVEAERAYREIFSTPEDARAASAQLADLDRLDALFFSRRPENHAELARVVASLDPEAFASLAQAMAEQARRGEQNGAPESPDERAPVAPAGRAPESPVRGARETGRAREISLAQGISQGSPATPDASQPSAPASQAQAEFLAAANAATVQSVVDAIESQVERLLPEGFSKTARNRLVGEIYREIDATLRSNRELGRQMRTALASGSMDAEHQRAVVSLVTGRARQALPAVAKRVLDEWTASVVAANEARRARQRAAEKRVDIAGAGAPGNDARRPISPRDIDYSRLSDADILNL